MNYYLFTVKQIGLQYLTEHKRGIENVNLGLIHQIFYNYLRS